MKFVKVPIFILLSLILVFIDQVTKYLASKHLKTSDIPLIKDILELTYVENSGAAFGIMQGKHMFFYILTVVVLTFIIYMFIRTPFTKHFLLLNISFLFIFSGAIGNFIDRVKHKFVVDFIYFKPINFPVFNFADICITIGTTILFLCMLTIYSHDDII